MKKWLNWLALVIVFSIACGFLANWQFSRRETKLNSIELVKKNYNAAAVTLPELLTDGKIDMPANTWRTVQISGSYLPESFLLVRNRPNDGQPGFEELVPFMSETLGVIFISRGWLPSGSQNDYPDDVPLPTSSRTSILARIVASEPILNRSAPKGQIATINVKLANQLTGLNSSFDTAYLRLISETPSVGRIPKTMPSPSIEEGNNLSYALQWILFALMAVLALIWRIKKDRELELGSPQKARVRRSDLDEAFEDETTRAK